MKQARPVILIHGFMAPGLSNLPLKWAFEARGIKAYSISLPFLNLADVRIIAKKISHAVEEILLKTGSSQCDMVGVSLGGISGLYYLQKLQGTAKVMNFIALGSPLKGSSAAYLATPLMGAFSKSVWQLAPGHDLLEEITAKPCHGTHFYSIHADNDLIAPPQQSEISWATNICIKGAPTLISHQSLIVSKTAINHMTRILKSSEEKQTLDLATN